MRIILWIALALCVAASLVWLFLRTPPADLARQLRIFGGIALIAVALMLAFVRQFALALPVGIAGYAILRRQAGMHRMVGGGAASSRVRGAGLEMELDHETGEMDGHVLAGRHKGQRLSALSFDELMEVGEDLRQDPDSLRLLESYLDRRHPGWRDDVQADQARRQSAPAGAGSMSLEEAYEILGLEAGAGEPEVRQAHRRLMKQLHPDRGGTTALAAKINEAKDRILGRHQKRPI